MLRRASHLRAAVGLVRFMSGEDGRLKSPPGISLCHQHLASALLRTRYKSAAILSVLAGNTGLCCRKNEERKLHMIDTYMTHAQTCLHNCTHAPVYLHPLIHTLVLHPMLGLTYSTLVYLTRACRFPSGTIVVLSWGCALTVVTDWSLLIC